MYTCSFFKIQELVPPAMYEQFAKAGNTSRLWVAFDDRILRALDGLRRRFGPLVVNSWATGGPYTESGLREVGTTTGSPMSQHKFGRGIDFRSRSVTPDEIHADLVASGGLKAGFRFQGNDGWHLVHRVEYYPGITWTHIDVSPDLLEDGRVKVFAGS